MRRAIDLAARLVATGLGSGHSPFAPGTAGSALGLLLFWPMAHARWTTQLAVCAILVVVGTVAATRVAQSVGKRDPGLVVVDEVAGQWLALVSLPFTAPVVLAGFLLFRFFDVVKPWPARDLERLPKGVGIMADDVAAGIYAHLVLRVGLLLFPAALP